MDYPVGQVSLSSDIREDEIMLTKGDEYPIHQTAEPVAVAGSDRNFYDRYFFNGYSADGSLFFAAAMGVYPHLNIIDGAVSILKDGKQTSLHLSRILHSERMDTQVGPLKVSVERPLESIRLTLTETEGISLDLTFEGRAFPIEEPRFTYRNGPRMVIDCTRMTQNGHWSGHISVDGQRTEVGGREFAGTRDRSWGVRPIGAGDPQPAVPLTLPQFYWIWTPLSFGDRSVFFHVNDDAHGHAWNTRASIVPDGWQNDAQVEMAACKADVRFQPGTRRAAGASISLTDRENRAYGLELEPFATFQMKGIGYGHPEWGHGAFKGDQLTMTREDIAPGELNWADVHNLHIQALSRATLTGPDGETLKGIGTFEQLFIGPHAPSGFRDILDPAE